MPKTVYLATRSMPREEQIGSPDELWEWMERHDYTASMSDDNRVYMAAKAREDIITAAVKRWGVEKYWKAFCRWGWGDGTPKPVKPQNWQELCMAALIDPNAKLGDTK